MDVKEAVGLAKKYIGEIFADEPISDLGLEEVEFDNSSQNWLVTIGFWRQWKNPSGGISVLVPRTRDYKVVRIADADGKMLSVKNREPAI
jgi:hypothetical protein